MLNKKSFEEQHSEYRDFNAEVLYPHLKNTVNCIYNLCQMGAELHTLYDEQKLELIEALLNDIPNDDLSDYISDESYNYMRKFITQNYDCVMKDYKKSLTNDLLNSFKDRIEQIFINLCFDDPFTTRMRNRRREKFKNNNKFEG